MVIEVVTKVVAEFPRYLGVIPVADNLTFTVDTGGYTHALESRGYTPTASCAHDCTLLSGVHVDPGYCSEGVKQYDAILSLTKPPGVQGIAGTGSSCQADQHGRPLWLVFAWHSKLSELEGETIANNIKAKRGLVIHEMLHTLGFSNSMFNYARDSKGVRKNLIKLRKVADVDGSSDNVWHFVKGRAFEIAQEYFSCKKNVTEPATDWYGLPLMGLPEAGRGSHWETRVMRDDVMSYGHNAGVSSITLAAMEDLGFYLANYSAADCMLWGYHQGCNYVKTRCGRLSMASTRAATAKSQCAGDAQWDDYIFPQIEAKCQGSKDPCTDASTGGWNPADSTCLDMCYTGPGAQAGCKKSPSSNPEGTSRDVLERLQEVDWKEWLILGVWVVGAVVILACVRRLVCPSSKTAAKTIAYFLDLVLVLLGGAAVFFAGFVWFNYDVFRPFIGQTTVIVFAIGGGAFLLWSLLMLLALCCELACVLVTGFWTTMLFTLLQIAATLLIVYWIYSLGATPADAVSTFLGSTKGEIDTFLSVPLQWAEGMVCRTYQTCCIPDDLGKPREMIQETLDDSGSGEMSTTIANTTCYGEAEVVSTGIEASLRDPSKPQFCYFTTGALPGSLTNPPPVTCNIIEGISSFSSTKCRSDFCEAGTDGYLTFLQEMIALLKMYGLPLGGIFAALVVLQWILACNLRTTRTHILNERDMRKRHGGTMNYVGAPTMPVNQPPPPQQAVQIRPGKRANSGALRRARKDKKKQPGFDTPHSPVTVNARA